MTTTTERMLPLYEAKMLNRFDHRDADVVKSLTAAKRQNQPRYLGDLDHEDPKRSVLPNYWISQDELPEGLPNYLTGFSNVTSATNQRTVLASALPLAGVGHSYPLFISSDSLIILAIMNSVALDYVAKQKVAGVNLTYGYVKQFPVPERSTFDAPCAWSNSQSIRSFLISRVMELVYTSYDIAEVAIQTPFEGSPFIWSSARRVILQAEIDASMFFVYRIDRKDADYILDEFRALRDAEIRELGEFRTKRLILEAYDAMQAAIDTGVPFESTLNPPPGEGPRHPAKGTVS